MCLVFDKKIIMRKNNNDCLLPQILCLNTVNAVIATIHNEFFCGGVWQYAPTNFISPLCPLTHPKFKGSGWALYFSVTSVVKKWGGVTIIDIN